MTKAEPLVQITRAECQARAGESRLLAQHASNSAQRVMLEHVADTWDRIVDTLPK